MTLEEAIKHAEEVAEENSKRAKHIRAKMASEVALSNATECETCADDHRQLAEWLTELKSRRVEKEGEWENVTTCTTEEAGIDTLQQMRCSVCKRWHTEPYIYYVEPSNYCPNCGARMKKG